jgi:predicted metal-dependent hydrolase
MIPSQKINVKRNKRKTVSIYVERDGSISVLVPDSLNDKQINEILIANEYKIYKYQAKRVLLNEKAVTREPVNGQSYLYLGRNYYLQYNNQVDKVVFKGRYLFVPKIAPNKLKDLFKNFYKNRGEVFLQPRVKKYAERMGVQVEEIAVLDLKNRWASCSVKKPRVNFHWKVMMATVSVIDYLIVHELAHFKHKRHDADFWNSVDKILPDYQKQVAWLKQYGASLDI